MSIFCTECDWTPIVISLWSPVWKWPLMLFRCNNIPHIFMYFFILCICIHTQLLICTNSAITVATLEPDLICGWHQFCIFVFRWNWVNIFYLHLESFLHWINIGASILLTFYVQLGSSCVALWHVLDTLLDWTVCGVSSDSVKFPSCQLSFNVASPRCAYRQHVQWIQTCLTDCQKECMWSCIFLIHKSEIVIWVLFIHINVSTLASCFIKTAPKESCVHRVLHQSSWNESN